MEESATLVKQYEDEISLLQQTRSVMEAIKQATDKIHNDISQAHKNNEAMLQESKSLQNVVDKLE